MVDPLKVGDRVWVQSPNSSDRTEGLILQHCPEGWVVRLGDTDIELRAPERFLSHVDAISRLGDLL